ncbi:hypothetical protein [Paraburkholderia humisilvae]|uniref:Uncharacterized protein n=1 Tax=Paraburkholderia humisilvae TaxID=627669 RepID=A0A6J5DLF3_9BURK|nr:hypothetical protein [Paraburkholderia humisilvae]CAB3754012.1 hypothetical protein LMG29542_02220 [Paraburkholderia humisilvae]
MKWVDQQDYFPFKVKPRIEGEYNLHHADGGPPTRHEFRAGNWAVDTASFVGWSGRLWQADKVEVVEAKRHCSRYRSGKSESKSRRVALSAVRVARFYGSQGKIGRTKAVRFYLIAHRIDPTALKDWDRAWQAANVLKLGPGRPLIEAQVDRFFGKRGEPVRAASPASA